MVNSQISRIKKYTDLPVVSGFGIKTDDDVKIFSKSIADGIVIGSGIVEKIQEVSKNESDKTKIANFVKEFCSKLITNLNS
jgi:tryptophan synthase alpha chain